MSIMSFEELSKTAYEYLNEQQDVCNNKYMLGAYEKWYYDQETGLIIFYNGEKIILRIKFEAVGTISLISNTWLWSWANSTTLENTATEILKVKEYGQEHGLGKLLEEKWDADMYDGWEMTAISAYLLQAKGAYRVPNSKEDIFSFKLFKEIEVVDSIALEELRKAQ